ncbi:MAG: HNH endonuclease [Melioribacteraceae bacterium]|nr:HNH endonuclease [Melioribacteraceae bacterium]
MEHIITNSINNQNATKYYYPNSVFNPGDIYTFKESKLTYQAKPIQCRVEANGCHTCISHSTDNRGYFHLKREEKNMKVHRRVYELIHGPIPQGLFVLHKCHNSECCNPKHLKLGDHDDNMIDRHLAGRTACGSKHGKSKLTDDQVKEIWFLLASGKSCASIARIFAVNPKTITDIKNGKTWKQVTDPLRNRLIAA